MLLGDKALFHNERSECHIQVREAQEHHSVLVDEMDILKIFSVVNNVKHYAMLQVAFFASLRASEVCDLDFEDINLQDLTVRVKCGKGRKPALPSSQHDFTRWANGIMERPNLS